MTFDNRVNYEVCEPIKPDTIQTCLCDTAEALKKMEDTVCAIGIHIYNIKPTETASGKPVECLNDSVMDIRERTFRVLSMAEKIRERLG